MQKTRAQLQARVLQLEKLVASVNVDLINLAHKQVETSELYDKIKAKYITISKAADLEYEKFCAERNELKELLAAKDAHIYKITEDLKHFSSMIRIIKTTVNSVVIQGEDQRDPRIMGR